MKRLRGWKKSAGVLVFVFSLSMFLLPGSVTTAIAAQNAAASAGAKAGAATAAGVSKGTIVAIIVAAAAIAGIIAASGDDDGGVVATGGASDVDTLLASTDATTEAALTQLVQSLTGAGELAFFDDFMESLDSSVLAEYQSALSENLTMADVTEALDALKADGLLKGTLQKQSESSFSPAAYKLYSALYDGLNNPEFSKGASSLAKLLASLKVNGNTLGLKGLGDLVRNLESSELAAVQKLADQIATDPTALDTLFTTLHPLYDVTVTTVTDIHGIKTTTTHFTKK